MALEIELRERDGVSIFDLKGRLVVGEAVGHLREKMQQSITSGKRNIVLNLEHCEYIDSTGLGSMVIGYTSAKKEGGMVKLLSLSKRNVELLVLTKLTTVFEIFDDEQQAVNSFFPNREIRHFDILAFLKEQEEKSGG